MENYINVADLIDSPSALSQEAGNIVYNEIVASFEKKEVIHVDFNKVESIISPFLNTAIGKLYGKYSSDTIKNFLDLKNFPDSKVSTLNVVISNAKKYYSNKVDYEKIMKEVIDIE